ncbi:MAG: methyltransferase domain-containing protein [Alphaproteobacteria bacterium]|nr:methyltransferase domain-containing protein [Alphaproteobacteria bacterium]
MATYSLRLGPFGASLLLNRNRLSFGLNFARKPAASTPPARAGRFLHRFTLGDGTETDGPRDMRPALAALPLPEGMAGRRAIDLNPADGFWSQALAARGATVVAVTPIWSRADGEAPATHEPPDRWDDAFDQSVIGLASQVRRERVAIKDLTTERFGRFDLAICAGGLGRARCPIRLMQRLRELTAPDGTAFVVQSIAPDLGRYPSHLVAEYRGLSAPETWVFWRDTLERMAADAGFDHVSVAREMPDPAPPEPGRKLLLMRLG